MIFGARSVLKIKRCVVAPLREIHLREQSRDISPSLSPTPDPFSEIDFHLNIRERLARVDKPETPPLGSTGG